MIYFWSINQWWFYVTCVYFWMKNTWMICPLSRSDSVFIHDSYIYYNIHNITYISFHLFYLQQKPLYPHYTDAKITQYKRSKKAIMFRYTHSNADLGLYSFQITSYYFHLFLSFYDSVERRASSDCVWQRDNEAPVTETCSKVRRYTHIHTVIPSVFIKNFVYPEWLSGACD